MANGVLHKTLREYGLSDKEAWAAQILAALPPEEFDALLARDLSLEQAIAAENILTRRAQI